MGTFTFNNIEMKKLLTLTLIVCLFGLLNVCQAQKSSKTLTAIEFSDYMSDITDSLYARGAAWGGQFNEARSSKDFSSLKPYRMAVDEFITRSLKSLRSMPDVKNSAALRKSMISFLEFEHKMVVEGFTPIEKLQPASSDAEVANILSGLQKLAENESVELKKVAIEQEAYAKANGFTIESEEEAQERER